MRLTRLCTYNGCYSYSIAYVLVFVFLCTIIGIRLYILLYSLELFEVSYKTTVVGFVKDNIRKGPLDLSYNFEVRPADLNTRSLTLKLYGKRVDFLQ